MGEIVSVSRRTDIPAFYWEWFISALTKGSVSVRNPFSSRTYRVSLLPEDVDCLIFWTKDPFPSLSGIDWLSEKGYSIAFHVTINGYGPSLEKNVAPWPVSAKGAKKLSRILGKDKVFWRFDPILPCEDEERTLNRFKKIADSISPYVMRCYVATFSPYRKATSRMRKENHPPVSAQKQEVLNLLLETGREYGLHMVSCASEDLENAGYERGACIDGEYLAKIFGKDTLDKKKNSTRPGCGCTHSRDIGTYRTCMHHCVYCYAS